MYLLSDEENGKGIPFINYLLITLNCIVFFIQTNTVNIMAFYEKYSFIPANFAPSQITSFIPVFTSMFLHGDVMHIVFNMWSLYIFGNNIEERVGHIPYIFLYLTGGFAATMTHYLFNMESTVYTIGASGAIAAVMGMYFIFFGENTLRITMRLTINVNGNSNAHPVKAWKYIGFWFLSQIAYSIVSQFSLSAGGIAWFAHIGGFMFGFLYADMTDKTDEYPWNKHINIRLNKIFGSKSA